MKVINSVETGWLVELYFLSGCPMWLRENSQDLCWTQSSLEAIRFCRRGDAEQVANLYRLGRKKIDGSAGVRVTEHQWG